MNREKQSKSVNEQDKQQKGRWSDSGREKTDTNKQQEPEGVNFGNDRSREIRQNDMSAEDDAESDLQ